eukprot:UN02045
MGTVLLQNGGDTLAVQNSGVFTFPSTIECGSSYSITVISENNGLSCELTNGSATNVIDDVEDVELVCTGTTTVRPGCTPPAWLNDMRNWGFPETLLSGLCIVNHEYYWDDRRTCVGGAGRDDETCTLFIRGFSMFWFTRTSIRFNRTSSQQFIGGIRHGFDVSF